jgi:hypothetical protein
VRRRQILCCGNCVLSDSVRYRFSVDTIVAAKEDSLLLPPELMHDAERRCDSSRRHVTASDAFLLNLVIAWAVSVACCIFYLQ